MDAQKIRERGVDIRNPEALEAFKVEILQELTAQIAELNETIRSKSFSAVVNIAAGEGESLAGHP